MKTLYPSKLKSCLQIKTVTWHKDSHGLFDYESKSLNVKKIVFEKPCTVWRKDGEIVIQDQIPNQDSTDGLAEDKILANLSLVTNKSSPENFSLTPVNPENKEIYLIIRSLKNKDGTQKGQVIEPGDILKLGRVEFKLLEIRNNENVKTVMEDSEYILNFSAEEKQKKKTCKICLADEEPQDEDGLYVNLCKCKGSCEYVHILCLKNWIQSKVKTKVSGATVLYKLKNLECEVCKEPLPRVLRYKEKKIPIFNIEKPECPYMILQGFSKEKKEGGRNSQEIYMLPILGDEPIKLGRGHICDIRTSDISVSRLHAYIKFENGNFVLTDNNSKFGTLLLLKNTLLFNEEKIAVQIGRTVLTLALKYIQVEPNLPKITANKFTLNNNNNNINNFNANGFIKKYSNEKCGNHPGITRKNTEKSSKSIGITKRKTNELLYD